LPIFEIVPNRSLPPLECGLGVRPSQADRSRAERKADNVGQRCRKHAGRDRPDPWHGVQPPRGLVSFCGTAQIGCDAIDARLRVPELADKQIKRHPGLRWQIGRLSFGNKTTHVVDALGHDQAELAQMGTDRVGKLGELTDKEVPRPMAHQHRLLGLGLDRHEARSALLNDPPDRSIRSRGPA